MKHLPARMSSSDKRSVRTTSGVAAFAVVALIAGSGCHGSKEASAGKPATAPVVAEAGASLPQQAAPPKGQVIDRVVANVAGRIVLYSELAGQLEQARQSGETVTPEILRLLATTELFLTKTTQARFRVVVSAV